MCLDVGDKTREEEKEEARARENGQVESELLPDVVEVLDELEKEKKYVEIQVCPKCKGPLVRRVGSMTGDMSAHMGFTPPKSECTECGWRERLVRKATNRPTSIKDVAIMAEAKDS